MVTIDLVAGRAWHRCWDASCAAADGTAARHELPLPPAAAVPSLEALLEFERVRGLRGPPAPRGGAALGGDDYEREERGAAVAAPFGAGS